MIALRKKPEFEDVLVLSNYQNAEYQMRLQRSFSEVLLNNYDSLEIENGCLHLKPYQTILLLFSS